MLGVCVQVFPRPSSVGLKMFFHELNLSRKKLNQKTGFPRGGGLTELEDVSPCSSEPPPLLSPERVCCSARFLFVLNLSKVVTTKSTKTRLCKCYSGMAVKKLASQK